MIARLFENKINPFKCVFHPFQGFYKMRDEKSGSIFYSIIILLVLFIATIYKRQSTGFVFNYNQLNDFNIFLILFKTLGLFVLWVAGNWAVATLMDGEGRAKEIWVVSAYSLIPYILLTIVVTTLSNVMLIGEGAFISYIMAVGILWCFLLIFVSLQAIHDYSFKQMVNSLLFTIIAIAIAIFLMVLFYTLLQQFYVFVYTLVNEILYRL